VCERGRVNSERGEEGGGEKLINLNQNCIMSEIYE